jgi:hypothetical protein
MGAVEVASLALVDGAVDKDHIAWSTLSKNIGTYATSMQTNISTFATVSVASLDLIDKNTEETQLAVRTLSINLDAYTKSMTANIEAWSTATVTAMDNVKTGAEDAEEAVKNLASAISSLKDKTVTITVDVQENSTSSQQYGGVKLLTHPQYVFGGEGHKPEIHMTFPLDQMSQSHATSAFKLPFNIGDLTAPKMGPPSFIGSGSNQPFVPPNLISNLRVNANLTIDLGNEIKKRVREEINAIAVTRLDRMPF